MVTDPEFNLTKNAKFCPLGDVPKMFVSCPDCGGALRVEPADFYFYCFVSLCVSIISVVNADGLLIFLTNKAFLKVTCHRPRNSNCTLIEEEERFIFGCCCLLQC